MSITHDNYDELYNYSINNASKLIVFYFKAIWCNPCKEIKPFFIYLQENYPNVDFIEIDIQDEDKETIVNNFVITKVPTFIFYKNGKLQNKLIGTNKEQIEENINEFL